MGRGQRHRRGGSQRSSARPRGTRSGRRRAWEPDSPEREVGDLVELSIRTGKDQGETLCLAFEAIFDQDLDLEGADGFRLLALLADSIRLRRAEHDFIAFGRRASGDDVARYVLCDSLLLRDRRPVLSAHEEAAVRKAMIDALLAAIKKQKRGGEFEPAVLVRETERAEIRHLAALAARRFVRELREQGAAHPLLDFIEPRSCGARSRRELVEILSSPANLKALESALRMYCRGSLPSFEGDRRTELSAACGLAFREARAARRRRAALRAGGKG
jgi:hypothetical protein